MALDLTHYLENALPLIQRRLTDYSTRTRQAHKGGNARALILLSDAATDLLVDIGLSHSDAEPTDAAYWSRGPELRLPEPFDTSGKLKQLSISPVYGHTLTAHQQILLLELQQQVLLYLESLGVSADDLLDLSASGFSRYPMARLAMHIAGRGDWNDKWFWEGSIFPAGVFSIRLLSDLERMLARTYENKPVATSVFLVAGSASGRLRWTNWAQMASKLFSGEKCGLRLSDGDETSFVFEYSGEFLGYRDTKQLLEGLEARNEAYFRWRVLPDRTLEGSTDREPCVVYAHGNWRYTNLNRLFQRLVQEEPSLGTNNRQLWELCLLMSRRREGALILIARDPVRLIADGVCREEELNCEHTQSRIGAKEGPEPPKPTFRPGDELPLKHMLLDQLRDRSIKEMSLGEMAGLARLDGAVVVSQRGVLLGFGVILRAPNAPSSSDEGARTTAARAASAYGLALKVSEDGPISAFIDGKPVLS